MNKEMELVKMNVATFDLIDAALKTLKSMYVIEDGFFASRNLCKWDIPGVNYVISNIEVSSSNTYVSEDGLHRYTSDVMITIEGIRGNLHDIGCFRKLRNTTSRGDSYSLEFDIFESTEELSNILAIHPDEIMRRIRVHLNQMDRRESTLITKEHYAVV